MDNPDTVNPEVDEPDVLYPACGKPGSIFILKDLDLKNNTEIIKEDMIDGYIEGNGKNGNFQNNRSSINKVVLNNEVDTYYTIDEIIKFIDN